MNQNWRLKSFVFRIIECMDAGWLLSFLQKRITRRATNKSMMFNAAWRLHEDALSLSEGDVTIFEFGAGQNLAQNIYLHHPRISQVLYDIDELLDFNLVNKSIDFLFKSGYSDKKFQVHDKDDLKAFQIHYHAPADARNVNLPTGSVDYILSTDTFEHIPKHDLRDILFEMKRLLGDKGWLSAKIDYSDHYAHVDKNISDVNFLRFSETQWQKYNHKYHYQNRMRHNDYRELLLDCGFDVIVDNILTISTTVDDTAVELLSQSDKDYLACSGYFLCVPRNQAEQKL